MKFWMVWKEGGGAPTYRHATREIAEKEAGRLALLHRGQEFWVLESTQPSTADSRLSRDDIWILKRQSDEAELESLRSGMNGADRLTRARAQQTAVVARHAYLTAKLQWQSAPANKP